MIGTLVERRPRTIRLLRLPSRDADTLHAAVIARMSDLPPELVRSITWDQCIEMTRHLRIPADLGAPVYFCDAHAPWQRGTNENSNGLLRQYQQVNDAEAGERGHFSERSMALLVPEPANERQVATPELMTA